MITISVGWWVLPTIITLLCFAFVTYKDLTRPKTFGDYNFEGITTMLYFGSAFVISLMIWLVYFIIF